MRMNDDDEALAQQAGRGDREAFQLLLERHYDLVYRLAFRFLRNQTDAEDLTQDICVALPRKLKSFRGDSKFTTWLYRVTINAARDQMRKRSNASKGQEQYVEAHAMAQADAEANNSQVAWLYESLDQLGDDLRETAILVLAEDLSHAESGKVLGVKEGTISWRMSEVRRQLKQQWQAQSADGVEP